MEFQDAAELLSELRAWCKAQVGRQNEIAALLGISKQRVSHYVTGRRAISLEHGLKLQAFLRKQRKPSKPK